jgi:hypothetical protein
MLGLASARSLRRTRRDLARHKLENATQFSQIQGELSGVKVRVTMLGALVIGSGLLNFFGHGA